MKTLADYIAENGKLQNKVDELRINYSNNLFYMAKEHRELKSEIESLNARHVNVSDKSLFRWEDVR